MLHLGWVGGCAAQWLACIGGTPRVPSLCHTGLQEPLLLLLLLLPSCIANACMGCCSHSRQPAPTVDMTPLLSLPPSSFLPTPLAV